MILTYSLTCLLAPGLPFIAGIPQPVSLGSRHAIWPAAVSAAAACPCNSCDDCYGALPASHGHHRPHLLQPPLTQPLWTQPTVTQRQHTQPHLHLAQPHLTWLLLAQPHLAQPHLHLTQPQLTQLLPTWPCPVAASLVLGCCQQPREALR